MDRLMSNWMWISVIYLSPLVIVVLVYLFRRRQRQRTSLRTLDESVETGLTEPPSLHPIVDPMLCIGCGSCAIICPDAIIEVFRDDSGNVEILIEPREESEQKVIEEKK